MPWRLSFRADPVARDIADRHYNRQSIGASQFVPPGRCLVLLAGVHGAAALWVTSWPRAEFVHHAWAGAWTCSAFRNEGAGLSSELVRAAVAATRAVFGPPPALGFVSFVDERHVRRKRDAGRCYLRAGWRYEIGADGQRARTVDQRLLVLRQSEADMPPAEAPIGWQAGLFEGAA